MIAKVDRFKQQVMQRKKYFSQAVQSESFKMRLRHRISHLYLSLIRNFTIFGLCFVILYPIYQMIVVAVTDPADLNNPLVILVPQRFSLDFLKFAIELLDYRSGLFNTFLMSTGVMVLTVMTTSLAGYAFAKLKFKGINVLFVFVIFTIVVPPQTIAMPLFIIFNRLGLTSTLWSVFILAVLGMGIKSGIFIFIFRQVFRNLPTELEEAALIDGCGVFKTFYLVMLPNARSAMVTVMLFSFVWQWNDVFFTRLLIAVENLNLLALNLIDVSTGLIYILQRLGVDQNLAEGISRNPLLVGAVANTGALLMMLPLLIGYIFVQRLFVESIERTGIVG
jgi:multiple sugar transport system permease protein